MKLHKCFVNTNIISVQLHCLANLKCLIGVDIIYIIADAWSIIQKEKCDVTDCKRRLLRNKLFLHAKWTFFLFLFCFCSALCCCIWSVLMCWQLDWIWWQLRTCDALCVSAVIGNAWFSCFRGREPEQQSVCAHANSQTNKANFVLICKRYKEGILLLIDQT